MSKIIGDEKVINKAKSIGAGDKSGYINFDAINDLPDEYEVLITEIQYDPKNLEKDFSPVGNGNYMPSPQLSYKIAEACGIDGGSDSEVEPVVEEVDINPILLKPLEAEPNFRKMIVGRKVSKYATRLSEDGTKERSSICTCVINVFERCKDLWSTEEQSTNGYSPDKIGAYPSGDKYFTAEWSDNGQQKSKKISLKYDTQYKRKSHFDTEMKFAHAKAETKAHTKAIRELAKLITGYKKEDLSSGSLFFSKVRRSRAVLKMETAARLAGLSKGGALLEDKTMLFGADVVPDATPDNIPIVSAEKFDAPVTEPPVKERTAREELIATLQHYQSEKLILPDYEKSIASMIAWLEGTPDAEDNAEYWPKAVSALKVVEAKIPEEGRLTHGKL